MTVDKPGPPPTWPTAEQRIAQKSKKRDPDSNLCLYLWCDQQMHKNNLCAEHNAAYGEIIEANDAIAMRRFMRRGELGPKFYAHFRPGVTKPDQ